MDQRLKFPARKSSLFRPRNFKQPVGTVPNPQSVQDCHSPHRENHETLSDKGVLECQSDTPLQNPLCPGSEIGAEALNNAAHFRRRHHTDNQPALQRRQGRLLAG